MTTDTSERGLERLICTALAGHPCEPSPGGGTVAEPPARYGGVGWTCGNPHDYDREHCVDLVQLTAFLCATRPEVAEAVALDVMQVWITDLHRTVEERAGTLDIADGEQLRRWREGLRANRIALARHRHQGLQRLNTALAVVEKLRLIETELAGALSADLRAALAWSRGGAGAAGAQ